MFVRKEKYTNTPRDLKPYRSFHQKQKKKKIVYSREGIESWLKQKTFDGEEQQYSKQKNWWVREILHQEKEPKTKIKKKKTKQSMLISSIYMFSNSIQQQQQKM